MALIKKSAKRKESIVFYDHAGKPIYAYKILTHLIEPYLKDPEKNKDCSSFYFSTWISDNDVKNARCVNMFFRFNIETKILSILITSNTSFKRHPDLMNKEIEWSDIIRSDDIHTFLYDNVSDYQTFYNRLDERDIHFDNEIIGIISIPDTIEIEMKENIFDYDTDWIMMDASGSRNPVVAYDLHNENKNLRLICKFELPLCTKDGRVIPLVKISDVYKTFLNKLFLLKSYNPHNILSKLAHMSRIFSKEIKDKEYVETENLTFKLTDNSQNRLKVIDKFDIDSIEDLKILDNKDCSKRYDFLTKNMKALKKKFPMGINVCGFKIKFPSSRRGGSCYLRVDASIIHDGELNLTCDEDLEYFERLLYCCGKLDNYKQVMRELILTLL